MKYGEWKPQFLLKVIWTDFDDIERKSTPEEIEEYKLRKDISKYNI